VLFMLEEIGAPYELKLLDLQKEEQHRPEYLAINPMGKVPAIEHEGIVITEVGAICTYLADAFPAAGLAPSIGDPGRGAYLRWMFFQGNCLEPAMIDHAMKREPGRRGMMPYGTYETTVDTLEKAVEKGPWFLGERYSAADVYVGSAIAWGLQFQLLPERDAFKRYAARLAERPARQRAVAIDEKIAAAKQA
jgi:glutathione S-transferase